MKICLGCEGVTQAASVRCSTCGAWLVPTDDVHYPMRRGEGDAGNPFLGSVVDGKYRLQAVLGRGGLGTVFSAQHTGSLLPVALKLLHPRFAEQREYRSALLTEARRAASVLHERCARLLDVGETDDGVAYLAMELVDGDTLEEVVRSGPLAPGHVAAILAQVVEALVAIHAAGLVHCDLSPRNVMVTARDGRLRVKVLDFGIARTISLGGRERTARSDLTGFFNPVFSAPEVLAGADVDARADFYSLGMLAQLLLTGVLPGEGPAAARPAAMPRGVPRRFARLVQRCLSQAPQDRPPSSTWIERELAIVRGSRRPSGQRLALAGLAVAVIAQLLGNDAGPPPFLRPRIGSNLELVAPGAVSMVQFKRSGQLATLGFHFGGFAADDLRLEVSRQGLVLLRLPLQPEVETAGEGLVLSKAQPAWRDALTAIANSCGDGPVDITFAVPGAGPLATARVRIDDVAPTVQWLLQPPVATDGALTSRTSLSWRADDDVGLERVYVEVALPSAANERFELQGSSGVFQVGQELAQRVPHSAPLGPVEVCVVAVDRTGLRSSVEPVRLTQADLAAPVVTEVTGPGGEPFVPSLSGRARMRVRLSAPEPGCRLFVQLDDGSVLGEAALDGASVWQDVDLPRVSPGGKLVSGSHVFVVVDAAGNRSERSFVLTLREQDLGLRLSVIGTAPALHGNELVFGAAGAAVQVECGASYRLVDASFATEVGATAPRVELRRGGEIAELHFAPAAPGAARLQLLFEETGVGAGALLRYEVPTRILPAAIEVRVPETASRFLPGLLQAGVLANAAQGLREGPGWRIDGDLIGYLRGMLWIGGDKLVPLTLSPRIGPAEAFLPEVLPVPGHNVFAVELRDVLGQQARVLVGDRPGRQLPVGTGYAVVVADFWWHEGAPEPIGEVVLVEFGQPALVLLRLPIAFRDEERAELRLGLASETAATSIRRDGDDRCTVRFDLPYATWAAAAGMVDLPRERYGDPVERTLDAYLATPLGRKDLKLRLRTARSTLRPMQLRELLALPEALGDLTMLPVLAPDAEFPEPLPPQAPPRAMFRPQVAVSVRNFGDLLLQDREFTRGQARALLTLLATLPDSVDRHALVHTADPLGVGRLEPGALLPASVAAGAPDDPVTGVDFFSAYACCRLLGQLCGDDPELFRLPLGCELELAAYGGAIRPSCYGAAACGGGIGTREFAQAAACLAEGTAVPTPVLRGAGDTVPTTFGPPFLGLDCGVREWVFDLPHVPGAELLLREWLGDRAVHLERCSSFARGVEPPTDLAGPVRSFGVVRGLALGEHEGLLGPEGERLDLGDRQTLPDSVPGVLRTEQLRRDGRDLLSTRADPRLSLVGFRLAAGEALIQRWRGRR